MNHIFRSIWNAARGTWVAVSEITKARGKAGMSGRGAAVASVLLAVLAPVHHAHAVSYFWDANGAGAGTGGTGTWNTGSALWRSVTATGPLGVWANTGADDAVFENSATGTLITVSGTINVHNINAGVGYSFSSGGVLNLMSLAGAQPVITTTALTTISTVISGTDGLVKSGSGVLQLLGANTYSGVTRLLAGTLTLGHVNALGVSGTAASNFVVSDGTAINFNGGNYAHNFTALGGTITVGTDAATWTGVPTLLANTTLVLTSGAVAAGNLADTGPNVLSVSVGASGATLSGNNTFTGPTEVTSTGLLTVGSPTALSPNSNLRFSVTPAGTGGLVLGADFNMNLGTAANQLQWLSGADGGFYSQGLGATRNVSLNGGAPLTWGVTPGFVEATSRLVLGSVVGGNSSLNFQNALVLPTAGATYQVDAIGGTLAGHARISGVISGPGNLTVGGSRPGFPTGLLELSNPGNSFTGNLVFSAPTGGGNVMIGVAGAVPANAPILFNGGAGSTGNTLVLTPASSDFTRSVTPTGVRWTGSGGFSAAGGNRFVNLGGAGVGLIWGANNFVPTGFSLNLAATSAGDSEIDFRNPIDFAGAVRTINVGTGGSARLSGVLSNGGVTYQGFGTVTPSAINTYSGVTSIVGTTNGPTFVNVSSIGNGGVAGNLGAAGAAVGNIVLNAGAINYVGAGETTDRGFTVAGLPNNGLNNNGTGAVVFTGAVNAIGGTLRLGGTNTTNTSALEGVISGAGAVIKQGLAGNAWRLGNVANSYTGLTQVASGVLEVTRLANGGVASSIGASGNAAANLLIGSNTTLRYLGTGDSTDRSFTGMHFTLESSGSGALAWTSTAPLVSVAMDRPILTLAGSNGGDNILSATVNDTPNASNSNESSSTVVKAGAGTWFLNGTGHTYTGNTLINGGALYAGSSTAITGGMGLNSNAPVPAAPGYVSTSKASSLIVLNGGVLGLTAASGDFARALTTATRAFNNAGTTGPGNFADDSFVHGVHWTGSGGFAADGGNRTVNLGGAGAGVAWNAAGFVPTGSVLILGAASADSTVEFVNPIDLAGTVARTVQTDNGAAAVDGILGGAVTGGAGVVKTGTGTLALTAANTYGGATDVQAGTLQVGNATTTGTLGAGNVTLGAGTTLAFARSNAHTVANTITGPAGTLVQMGAGTTTLTAAKNEVGATVVTQGTLDVDNALTSNTLLMGTGTLIVDQSFETAAGATVAMSSVAGTSSTLLVNGTARVNGDLGDGADRVAVGGTATLDVGAAALLLGSGSDDLAVAGKLTGSGRIELGLGNDVLTLSNNYDPSAYTGVLDGGAGAGEVDSLVANNANTATAMVVAGARLADFEQLNKLGAGAVTLTGAQGYALGTTIFGGALNVEGTLETPTVGMKSGTTLDVKAAAVVQATAAGAPAAITGSTGAETVRVGAGATLRATGDLGDGNDLLDVEGNLEIGGAGFDLGDGDDTLGIHDGTKISGAVRAGLGTDNLDVNVGAARTARVGGLSEFESLIKRGAGIFEIEGVSNFAKVDVVEGFLDILAAGSVAASKTEIRTGGELRVSGKYTGTGGDDTMTIAGTASGTGTVDLGAGIDVLTLSDGAKLNIVISGGTGSDTLVIDNTAAMAVPSAKVAEFEKLEKRNTGAATLAGVQTYAEGSTITGGKLIVAGTLNTPTMVMKDDTTLAVSGIAQNSAGTPMALTGSDGVNTVVLNAGATLFGSADLKAGKDRFELAGTLNIATGSSFLLGDDDDTLVVFETAAVTGKIDGGAGVDEFGIHIVGAKDVEFGGLTNFESLTRTGAGLGHLVINDNAAFVSVNVLEGALRVASTSTVGAQTTLVRAGAELIVQGEYKGTSGKDTMTIGGKISGTGTVDLGDGDDTLIIEDLADLSGLATSIKGGLGINSLVTNIASKAKLGGVTQFQELIKTNVGELSVEGPAGSDFNLVDVRGGKLVIGANGSITGVKTIIVGAGTELEMNGVFSGSALDNTMTVAGRFSGSKTLTLGDANDTLTLQAGAVLDNTIDAKGGSDTLAIDNGNPAVAVIVPDARVLNFERLEKRNVGEARVLGNHAFVDGTALLGGKLGVGGILTTPSVTIAAGTTFGLEAGATVEAAPALPGGPPGQTTITGSAGVDTVNVGAGAVLRATGDLGDGNDAMDLEGELDLGTGIFTLGAGDDIFRMHPTTKITGSGQFNGGAGNDLFNINTGANDVPVPSVQDFESLGKSGVGKLLVNGDAAFITVDIEEGTLEVAATSVVTAHETFIRPAGILHVINGYMGTDNLTESDLLSVEGRLTGTGTVDLRAGDDILRMGAGGDTSALAIPLSGGTGANEIQADIAAGGSATVGSTQLFQKLTKTGAGVLRIAGTASEVALVDVQAGTLEIMAPGGSAPGGSLTGAKTTTVAAGATLQVDHLYSGTAGDDTVTMAGDLSGTGTVDLQAGNDVFHLDSSGRIAPTLALLNGGDGVDTFVLGGTGNALFDVGLLGAGVGTANPKPGTGAVLQKAGAAIQNFESLRKEGPGVWTLTGLADATQNWTIAEGTLVGNTDSLQGKINNQATLVFDQAADGTYANSLSGTGRMFKRGAGMLDLTGDSPMSGATTVEQGRLQVTGAISSPVAVEAGGILGGTGAVRGAVTNAGVVAPGTPSAMGTLTIQGDYAGNGGQLAVRAVLGGSASPADRLVIDGGHISGTTPVAVAPQGGSGALTDGLGINVVSLVNGATQVDKSFTLGAPVVVGPFQYDLVQAAPSEGSGWYLRSRDTSPLAPPGLPRQIAAASPEVSLNSSLGTMAQLYGTQSLGTLHTRDDLSLDSLQSHGGSPGERRTRGDSFEDRGIRAWTRAFGTHGRLQGGGLQARGADFSYDSAGLQAGADMQVHQDGAIRDRAGGYAGIGRLGADVKHIDGTEAGHNSLRAYSVGAYWTRTSQEGWYVDTVAQYTRFDRVRTASVQGIQGNTRGWGAAASVEGGMSLPLQEGPRDRVSIEPQAQLIVQRTQLDDVRDSQRNDVGLGGGNSVQGRVGARMVRKWYEPGADVASSAAWARVNVWREFAGSTQVTYQTAAGPLAYGSRPSGTWAELELGFSTALTPSVSLQGSVSYQRGLSGMRREGVGLNAAGNADAMALLGAGVGLSTKLSPNATLRTRATYGTGAKGQANAAAIVDLDLRW